MDDRREPSLGDQFREMASVQSVLATSIFKGLLMRSAFLLLTFWLMASAVLAESLPLVPQPVDLTLKEDELLQLPSRIRMNVPDIPGWKQHAEIFSLHVNRITTGKHRIAMSEPADCLLSVHRDDNLAAEAYKLEINDQIRLTAATIKGLAHGTATLLQIIGIHKRGTIPQLLIRDAPKLSYRNFLIDMGRNPQSLDLLKETLDLFWFYKIDSIQLHLTDDQRFAFPSTAFPKLWDGKITLEQFKELEAYATIRGITIIPELEVPGHSGILRRQYPDVFGATPTELAQNETALQAIKTLLDEMMDVFASTPYIHVGGDEAYGVPQELQRDLINKLHSYLKSKGRQTIVWEGPHPGKRRQ